MTKFEKMIEQSIDRITDELQKTENKHKIHRYIVDPILKELSEKIQPFFYLMVIMYLLLFVPLVVVFFMNLLKSTRRKVKYSTV